MTEERIKEIIKDWHSDFNNHYADWDKGKINDTQMLNYMFDSCFFLFREVTTNFLENLK